MVELTPVGWPSAHRPLADQFAAVALYNIACEYPNKLDHVMNTRADVLSPRELHPVFYGSYDWHSAVHMHWMLARLLRLLPELAAASAIASQFDLHFSATHVAGEVAYLQQASRGTFERTYGWAWLLKLQTELNALATVHPRAAAWRDALQPLADMFVARYLAFLPKAQSAIRAGTHANSAFGLLFALEHAQALPDPALRDAIIERARNWFGHERRYPAHHEPGGDDFLSGGLIEAVLMSQVLNAQEFAAWWENFCPDAADLALWFDVVSVGDRTDAKMSHLDGLNLSRAWCWRILQPSLPATLSQQIDAAVARHLSASLPHAASGDYVGTHWLASFATLALTLTAA